MSTPSADPAVPQKVDRARPLVLRAESAADLMTPNPVSIREEATFGEALVLLTDKGLDAAPVVGLAGRPAGVLTQGDILAHAREQVAGLGPPRPGAADPFRRTDPALVRDLMTPAVFSVKPWTPAAEVVEQIAALEVNRLFVVDDDGVVVGVIGARDVLARLRP